MQILMDHEIKMLKKAKKHRNYVDDKPYLLFEYELGDEYYKDTGSDVLEESLEVKVEEVFDLMPSDRVMVRAITRSTVISVFISELSEEQNTQARQKAKFREAEKALDQIFQVIECTSSDIKGLYVGQSYKNDKVYSINVLDVEKIPQIGQSIHRDDDMSVAATTIVTGFLNFLKSRDYKMCENQRVKMHRAYKGVALPKCYTYLSTSKEKIDSKLKTDVEWSHCWKVMGHYRKHNGIGKNRAGDRCIAGKTWVKEHYKQNHLDYVEKVRILK